MKCLSFFILSAVLTVSTFVYAKETDNITGRYKNLADSTEVLDQEMNRRLQKLVDAVNKKGIACNKSAQTFRDIRVLFHEQNESSFAVGAVETWAEKSDKVAKRKASPNTSVYEGVLSKGIIFNKIDLASTIKVNGELIGTDKFGHFIDQGFERYRFFRERGNQMDVALDGSKGVEGRLYGGGSTGITSYADMTANYHGILFYHALVDTNNPYLACSGGQWVQSRNFTWADYVDSAWDEGINCSQIDDAAAKANYDKNVQKLETQAKEQGKSQNYRCPVDANACAQLRERYLLYERRGKSLVLAPECVELGKATPKGSSKPSSGTTGTSRATK